MVPTGRIDQRHCWSSSCRRWRRGDDALPAPLRARVPQHRKVESLFEQFEKAKDNASKQKLAQEICTELTVHATIEEEIFYPACEEAVEEDLGHQAYVEHDGAKVLIAEIAQSNPKDEFYNAYIA
jgi:hemerythrin superfamily protein